MTAAIREAAPSHVERTDDGRAVPGRPSGPPPRWLGNPRLVMTAALMFILHSVHASWVPIFPRHLQALGVDADGIALFFGLLSIATMLAPWLSGQIADRLVAAERMIVVCLLACAALMWFASRTTSFWPLTGLMVAIQLLYMPTFALCNHIAFSQLRSGPRNFGYVRLFGTAGWVLGSWLCGWVLSWSGGATMGNSLLLAAATAIVAALLCAALPLTPPTRTDRPRNVARASLAMLRMPDVAVLMLVSMGLSLASPFVYPHGSLFLASLGVSDAEIPPILSLGQMVEVVSFALMASLARRFRFKTLFCAGLVCWNLRFAIWALGSPFWLIVASMGLHGICYAMIYGLGMIYIDRRSTPDIRASAQGLHLVLTMGLPIWPGNWIAAQVTQALSTVSAGGQVTVHYAQVFLAPLALTLVLLGVFAFLFREPAAER